RRELLCELLLLAAEPCRLCFESREACPRAVQPRVERIEVERRPACARAEVLRLPAQRASGLRGPGCGDAGEDDRRGGSGVPRRRSCQAPRHEGGTVPHKTLRSAALCAVWHRGGFASIEPEFQHFC